MSHPAVDVHATPEPTPATEAPGVSPETRFAQLLGRRLFGDPTTSEAKPDTIPSGAPGTPPPASGDAPPVEGATATDEAPKTPAAKPTTASRWDELDDSLTGKVKVDGEEAEVSLGELKRGFSFQSRNTRVAQQLAEEKKAFAREREEKMQEVETLRNRYAEVLPKLEEFLAQGLDEFAGVNWEQLAKTNPTRFAELRARYDLKREQIEAVRAEKEAEQARLTEEYQARLRDDVERETALLLESVPEWKDEALRGKELTDILEFATKELGFEREALMQVYDRRAILALRYATKYHQMMRAAESARSKVATSGVQTATAGTDTEETLPDPTKKIVEAAKQKLKSSGSVKDAAELFGVLRGSPRT